MNVEKSALKFACFMVLLPLSNTLVQKRFAYLFACFEISCLPAIRVYYQKGRSQPSRSELIWKNLGTKFLTPKFPQCRYTTCSLGLIMLGKARAWQSDD